MFDMFVNWLNVCRFKMHRRSLASSITQRWERCWRTFAFTMSPLQGKKKARQHFLKSKKSIVKLASKSFNQICFSYVYPTTDELAAQILFVMSHFGLKTIIGFGIGAGANILVRFGLSNPDKVGALCLVNCSSTQAGWIEWGYQSMNTRNLRSKGMTQGVLDYLMWHHFGRAPEERNLDLVSMYKSYFERSINPVNLVIIQCNPQARATLYSITCFRLCSLILTWNVPTWTSPELHQALRKLVSIWHISPRSLIDDET